MKRIYIIGLPSSGKTTLGKPMAQQIGYDLVDLDHYIEQKEGCSITDIFKYQGENYFRKVERKALHEVSKKENLIISTGGGVPCFFDNMKFMSKNGLTIFLDVSVDEIFKRMTQFNGIEERPMFKGKKEEEIKKELEEKYNTRYPFYNDAQIVLKGDNIQVEHLVEAIKGEI